MPIIIHEFETVVVPDNSGGAPEASTQPTGEVNPETLFTRLSLAREREARLAVD